MDDLSHYRGNSHRESSPEQKRETRAPIISAPPRRVERSTWGRFRDMFAGQDARGVGASVLFDVVVPAVKDLFYEVITEGAHRGLYGDSAPRNPRLGASRRSQHTPYNQASRREFSAERRPELDRRDRALHDFSSLIFRNAGEATTIADHLYSLVDQYGVATVNDFYEAAGITGDFADSNFGWSGVQGLRGTRVRRVRDGYILEVPRPRPID